MPFKAYYGQCLKCEPGITRLIIVRRGYCKFHNEEQKNIGKPKKVSKPKVINTKKIKYGQCVKCEAGTGKILATKYLCKFHNDQKKKEEKSKRVVRLVNKADKNKSYPQLKKQLWELFSEYIRIRDSKDGMFTCISCGTLQSVENGNLQCGHYYKSETYPALRYSESNNNGQCKSCNIFKEGNRQGYEQGMLKKYGQATIDMLKISCHNKIRLGRFELELLIKEYAEKLRKIKQTHD